jgi:NADP-dependent 3-hydroxy acid dehydrogenase YdfG
MNTINDKVVVILGASSGIGEATVRLLAGKGAKLVIASRREEKLKELADSLEGCTIAYKTADVASYEEVKAVIDMAVELHGRVDVLYNNAGIMPTAPLIEGRRNEWRQLLDINVMGVLNGISAVLPIMVEQQSGHIIATDSVLGHHVYENSTVYCGTKFAVRAIMEGLRQEHRMDNIKSTIISPGNVATDLYKSIQSESARQAELDFRKTIDSLTAEDIATAVAYAIETPDRMSVSEIMIRPTKQGI